MTIIELFLQSVKKYPENPFLWENIDGNYKASTYLEIYERVELFANGLLSLGFNKQDKVVLVSEGRNDWIVSELAVLFCGGVCVPVTVKIEEPSELLFRIVHSEASFVVLSAKNLPKVEALQDEIKAVKKIIVLDEIDKKGNTNYLTIGELMNLGHVFLKANPQLLANAYRNVVPDDVANICYTSGTTADPKGILLTHKNYYTNACQSCSLFEVPPWYISLMILPWDHSFAHTVGIYTLMMNGASLASVQQGKTQMETLKNVSQNIKQVKPVFLLSVPALAKNFKMNIEKGVRQKGKVVEMLFRLGLSISCFYNGNGFDKGKGFRILVKPLKLLFDALIFKKIRNNFGGRLRFFVGGGALLDIEFQKFFYALGIPMYQGYGLTEAAPVISSNTPEQHKLGTSGRPVQGLRIRICDEKGTDLELGQKGEIVVSGENIMAGYWKNPETTSEVLRDGWLYTGDMGCFDQDGFLMVSGRFKSLLISSDGEKYSPEAIEESIELNSTHIRQIMLYNNQNAYTIAIVVPEISEINRHLHAESNKYTEETYCEKAIILIKKDIDEFFENGRFGGRFPSRWLPAAFSVVAEPFTEQNQMVNSTMKIVRSKITEAYKDNIEFLYSSNGKKPLNLLNIEVFSRYYKSIQER